MTTHSEVNVVAVGRSQVRNFAASAIQDSHEESNRAITNIVGADRAAQAILAATAERNVILNVLLARELRDEYGSATTTVGGVLLCEETVRAYVRGCVHFAVLHASMPGSGLFEHFAKLPPTASSAIVHDELQQLAQLIHDRGPRIL